MSRRRDGCSGKKKHPNRSVACIARRRQKLVGTRAYKCRVCGMWHLGRSNRPYDVQQRISAILGDSNAAT